MVKKMIGNYGIERAIGSGGFSKVYLARHMPTGETVAVKRIKKDVYEREKIVREIKLLESLDHPFTVQFYELIEDEEYYYLAMEYVQGTTLLDLVNTGGKMQEWKMRHIFVELITCVAYLHNELNIAHRDIKLENIIFDNFGNIRLIDFGLGNKFDVSDGILQTACGSPAYAPPEMFLGVPYTDAADMWSLGCVLFAMATNRLPFEDPNAKQLAAKIVYQQPDFPEDLRPSLVTLIQALLAKDPAQRPTAQTVLKFEWINSYPNREMFSASFGLEQNWRSKRGKYNIDQSIVSDLKQLNLYTPNTINDMLDNQYTPEAANYRVLKRKKVTYEMEKLYEAADTSLMHILGAKKPHMTLTPTALSVLKKPQNARNKYTFCNVCSPITGVSRLSATVKLSNRINGSRLRNVPKPTPIL